MIALTVAQKVRGVVITSSPSEMPAARTLRCIAAVQELTAAANGCPLYAANSLSKRATRGPVPIQPDSRQCTTSSISSCSIAGAPKIMKSDGGIEVRGRKPEVRDQRSPAADL